MSHSRTSWLCAVAAVVLAALIPSRAGLAYTPEQQQACTPDAMRLCGDFVPNVDAITACMIQKKAQLSPQCRVFFRSDPEPAAAERSASPRPTARTTSSKPAAAKKTTASKKKKAKDDDT